MPPGTKRNMVTRVTDDIPPGTKRNTVTQVTDAISHLELRGIR